MITNISLKSNQVLGFSFFELDHCFHTENFQKSENFDDLKRYWEICKEKPLKFNFFVEVTDVSGVPGYDEPMVTLIVNKQRIEVARKVGAKLFVKISSMERIYRLLSKNLSIFVNYW